MSLAPPAFQALVACSVESHGLCWGSLPYCLVWPPWIKAGLWWSFHQVCHGRSHCSSYVQTQPKWTLKHFISFHTSGFRGDTGAQNMGCRFPRGCPEGQRETGATRKLADKCISLPFCKGLFQGAMGSIKPVQIHANDPITNWLCFLMKLWPIR